MYDTEQLSEALRISQAAIIRMIKSGELPESSVPGDARFSERLLNISIKKLYVGNDFKYSKSFPNDWLKAEDVAALISKSKFTVLRYVRDKKIPFYKLGPHTIRFRRLDIVRWSEGMFE